YRRDGLVCDVAPGASRNARRTQPRVCRCGAGARRSRRGHRPSTSAAARSRARGPLGGARGGGLPSAPGGSVASRTRRARAPGAGETVGLVGETGCGKSVTALSLLRLVGQHGRVESTSLIEFEGKNLATLDEESMRAIRGARLSMVFQEPMTALNPVFTVGDQIAEVVRVHHAGTKKEAWDRAVKMLETVGIPAPAQRAKEYPHQLSGGMRQRVVIAMALVMNPALVIADEPTTALDVTIQAQILELLRELQQKFGTSILLITHDLGVVAETVSRVIVMYGGEIVEQADVRELFASAHHPYTEGLLNAMPRVGARRERLATIPASVPPATAWPAGSRFPDRCPPAWGRS